mmetsp:Transcript_93952/g.265887  ORF Transcript_93952/g.265887 Transcript_93952/m.265887 type:complete len:234 (+) Transcript_93952:1344-2045(+)
MMSNGAPLGSEVPSQTHTQLKAVRVGNPTAQARMLARIGLAASSATCGMRVQLPSPLNSHPWYAHCRQPVFGSILPSDSGARRCGQAFMKTRHSASPASPASSDPGFGGTRHTTRSSPSMRTGVGRSGSSSRSDATGNQYCSRQEGAATGSEASRIPATPGLPAALATLAPLALLPRTVRQNAAKAKAAAPAQEYQPVTEASKDERPGDVVPVPVAPARAPQAGNNGLMTVKA